MSDAVFPILPGLAWGIKRASVWSSNQGRSKSGRRYAVGDRQYPTWRYRLPFEFFRQYGSYNEYRELVGFINKVGGARDDWLYRDPDDYQVANHGLGVGDGTTVTFPLVRELGGFAEPIENADVVADVKADGTALAYGIAPGQWRVDQAGPRASAVIFATAPAPGVVLTWSGRWYWRCAFRNDVNELEQFLGGLWKGDVEFETVPR